MATVRINGCPMNLGALSDDDLETVRANTSDRYDQVRRELAMVVEQITYRKLVPNPRARERSGQYQDSLF